VNGPTEFRAPLGPCLRHSWPTFAPAWAAGHVVPASTGIAHKAKKPAAAEAGRAEGGDNALLT
jgi:hypothetical protein